MSDYFEDIINGTLDFNEDIFTEATSDMIPYNRTIRRRVILPMGSPVGKGVLCYLYSHNINESMSTINNATAFKHLNKIKTYFYNMRYYGKIYNKRYKFNDYNLRKEIYNQVKESNGLSGKLRLDITNFSCFFEMSRYISIFEDLCSTTLAIPKYMEIYWNYISAILSEDTNTYDHRFLLIDLNNFTIGKDLKSNLKNPLFMIYYTIYKNKGELMKDIDLDWYFYNGDKILKINPKDIYLKTLPENLTNSSDKISAINIKNQMSKLMPKYADIMNDSTEDENIKTDEIADEVINKNKVRIISNGGQLMIIKDDNQLNATKVMDNKDSKDIEKITKDVIDNNKEAIKDLPKDKAQEIIDGDVRRELEQDRELLSKEYYKNVSKASLKNDAFNKRDRLIKEQQLNLKVGDVTINDLKKLNEANIPVDITDISNVVDTTNENMKELKFINHDKTYNEKLMKKDITNAVLSLNDKPIPMYIIKINVEDTSTESILKDTYEILFEDANRKRHSVKVDIPKFIENKFLYIGGNYKILKHQNMLLPVIKTSENTVQLISNYSKMTISRQDVKSLSYIERFKKMINKNADFKKYFTFGMSFANNRTYLTGIEYDEYSKSYIDYKKDKCYIMFSQVDATKYANEHNIKVPDNGFFIGTDSEGKNIIINMDDQLDQNDRTITEIIIESLGEEAKAQYGRQRNPARLMTASVRLMEKNVYLGVILCLWEGLSTVLKKLNIEYRLENRIPSTLTPTEDYIVFKDSVLVYHADAVSSLILSGISMINTKEFNIEDFDTNAPYANYILKVYGKSSIENALFNFYEFFIDPITEEVCMHESMPTDIVSLMIYATNLLADSQYTSEINENFYRVRMGEVLPAILYKEISKAYLQYKNSNGKSKFSIKRDAVINEILSIPSIEDYSTLNPILEMEQLHAISNKGFRGVNLDESYTPPKRVFDKSAIGIISPSTSPDSNVGIAKQLTMEPNITSIRGYIEDKSDDLKSLSDVNVFSPGELAIPLGATVDDPTRLGHAMKQSRQTIPVVDSSPVLISNGLEETTRFQVSSSFAINADEDGTIVDYDPKLKIMIAEYKSGKHRAIDLKPKMVKNSGGGFYLANELVTDLKVGDKFKVNEVLAYHKNFFTNSRYNACRMNMGTLAKVAITTSYDTYEDATFITESLSERAATEMCFKKTASIGKNANVFYMCKKGSEIKIGDPLIEFDESFDDESINSLLFSLGLNEEEQKDVISNSRNQIKSKYSGVIEDIKIFSTVDLDDLSPSLREIVNNHYKEINKTNKFLDKYSNEDDSNVYKCGILLNESSHKVEVNRQGVFRGEKVEDGVLIEFYIKHSEPLEVGSKIANFTALKNTICEIVPKGYEPYSQLRPDEEISTFIASNSILARMTPSIILTAFGNKCIIELKRALKELYPNRKEMEDLIYKFFTAFDKTGNNTKKYQALFKPMSDTGFKSYFNGLFNDEKAYLVLDVVDYERDIKMDDIERAAKVLNIPLYEHVFIPHISMDKSKVVVTKEKVPVGYIPIKRTQQTIMKKNGLSTEISKRSPITGQVTGKDKNGRESDLENIALISWGMKNALKELNSARADDRVMKDEMLQSIALNGYARLEDLTDDINNKVTLNTVDTYLRGMGLFSDLVVKGLMLPKTLNDELR